MSIKERFEAHIFDLQDRICNALEISDGIGFFNEDKWERPGGMEEEHASLIKEK